MTTPAAERRYLARHLSECFGDENVVYNPEGKQVDELPRIYGFNNGGSPGWYFAQLIAEDGMGLGGHICSHEGYMRSDLQITRCGERHECFRDHYPGGYVMEFVPRDKISGHTKLQKAFELNEKLGAAAEADQSQMPSIVVEVS